MTRHHCIATLDEDDDALTLHIELADERAIELTYPKNKNEYGPPYVSIWDGASEGSFDEYFATPEEFEDWAKIALGIMNPARERQFLCQICKQRSGHGPVVHDEIWAAITPAARFRGYRALMCLECMQWRATKKLGRKLTPQDLTACPWNAEWLTGEAAL
jgi:hypothetical protein